MTRKEALFKDIFDKNNRKVYHLCYGYTGDSEAANDLMQETFIKVWQNLDRFRNQSQISTWIYRIAVNTCLSYLRVEKRKATDEINERIIETKADDVSDKQEQVNQLYKCISQLEENERIIITMVLDEMPYQEIAEISGISEGNLRVKIHRIKSKLTEIYNRHERF
ncbi:MULTISPECIES: RNA polymerase sigma factor [Olivibacter]|uniref:RNA polymerase, sigma-24 subunit, ECF subfamily n=2 Tax=Sphingobacteriaceae TaxID=84566 RepID=F4C5M9_SPHS2|nr:MULTISPECIES: RNA polymerase sigma factor [Olivibacter]MCL4637435.1 RNA polymerase sigma factor [Olivibacter sp. UJ_SKK_5.1]MDM8175154.1 RNA polymerase sigma factor [Olivibacter sp. 47]MDX3913169.1 RNA polymerase sigma factor [Pseudosphingobacterium sp.]QEL01925.1 RNA polymerase sigma factor [Olivibacter sp. LS-1]